MKKLGLIFSAAFMLFASVFLFATDASADVCINWKLDTAKENYALNNFSWKVGTEAEVKDSFSEAKDVMSSKVEAAKDATVSAAVQVKDAVVAAANYVKHVAENKMTEAKDAVCSKAEEVKNVDSETKDQSAAVKK